MTEYYTEVIAALILDLTISRQQIITDADLFAVAHFEQIQILSSLNVELIKVNKETSDP